MEKISVHAITEYVGYYCISASHELHPRRTCSTPTWAICRVHWQCFSTDKSHTPTPKGQHGGVNGDDWSCLWKKRTKWEGDNVSMRRNVAFLYSGPRLVRGMSTCLSGWSL